VARNRYIAAVQSYNTTIRSLPSNFTAMAFGYKPKENFTEDNEAAIAKAPSVDFGGASAPAPAPSAKP
jgi:LemA protein